jgi:hypothetical protein
MFPRRRSLLTGARVLMAALILSLSAAGVPVLAAHVTSCDMPASHCQGAMLAASCCCHGAASPAVSTGTAAVGVAKMPVAAVASAPASSVCGSPVATRADYSLARGRQFTPLRILYASLLI